MNTSEGNGTLTSVPAFSTTDPFAVKFSTSQFVLLGIYCIVATALSLLGNGTVLYASLRYNAIDLDRITVFLVQNLTIADILVTFFKLIPATITVCVGKWMLGDIYCFIAAQLHFIPLCANNFIILAITAYKLRMVTRPFSIISKPAVKATIGGIWIFALTPTSVSLAFESTSEFIPGTGTCSTSLYQNESAELPVAVLAVVFVLLPLCLIIAGNVILAAVAIRSASRLEEKNCKAIVTVCSLCGLLFVSWIPWAVDTFVIMAYPDHPMVLTIINVYIYFLSTFGNPIIYCLTNKRFGRYVRRMWCGIFCGREIERPRSSVYHNSRACDTVLSGMNTRHPSGIVQVERIADSSTSII